jgi:hypothetical protein
MALFYRCPGLRLKLFPRLFPVNEQTSTYALYKKLLQLYPREFREQLGESMEQTFRDLYRERQTEGGRSSFVLLLFVETVMGIVREHALLLEGVMMKTMLANPISAVVISFIFFVLPFMILEWATRSDLPRSDASPLLWIVMWLPSAIFIAILMPIVRNFRRAGNSVLANPVSLLLRVGILVFLAWTWGTLVIDQMPCFLGGSGC